MVIFLDKGLVLYSNHDLCKNIGMDLVKTEEKHIYSQSGARDEGVKSFVSDLKYNETAENIVTLFFKK